MLPPFVAMFTRIFESLKVGPSMPEDILMPKSEVLTYPDTSSSRPPTHNYKLRF